MFITSCLPLPITQATLAQKSLKTNWFFNFSLSTFNKPIGCSLIEVNSVKQNKEIIQACHVITFTYITFGQCSSRELLQLLCFTVLRNWYIYHFCWNFFLCYIRIVPPLRRSFSLSLVIRLNLNKTTLNYHLTSRKIDYTKKMVT